MPALPPGTPLPDMHITGLVELFMQLGAGALSKLYCVVALSVPASAISYPQTC